jgi:metal-sulfur cluster biosynthetic enzyme
MNNPPRQKVTWQAETTHPELIATVKEALRKVVDPEIGLNIVELGLVRDVIIEKDQAKLNMILTTPFCPYGPALLEMSRQQAESALKIPTVIELGMEMWDFSMMEEGAGADWGMY